MMKFEADFLATDLNKVRALLTKLVEVDIKLTKANGYHDDMCLDYADLENRLFENLRRFTEEIEDINYRLDCIDHAIGLVDAIGKEEPHLLN